MWQYTSSGKLAGWDGLLDLNAFFGDRNTWLGVSMEQFCAVNPGVDMSGLYVGRKLNVPSKHCVVQPNDALSVVTQNHGLSLEQVLRANPTLRPNPNLIHAGQLINITLRG